MILLKDGLPVPLPLWQLSLKVTYPARTSRGGLTRFEMHLGRTNQPIASPHWLVAHFRRNQHIYSSSKNVQSGSSGQVVPVRNYRTERLFESCARSLKPLPLLVQSRISITKLETSPVWRLSWTSRFSNWGGNF